MYSVVTGEPSRQAALWAAVLASGPDAALSHQSAAELFKLTDEPGSLIHISIPQHRRVSPAAGIVVHRSSRLAEAVHPNLLPRRTRIEETVLDLVAQAADFDSAFGIVCTACQHRTTTVEHIVQAMSRRKKLRWRAELAAALGQVRDGVNSLLEYRYVQLVERPHRLPAAIRQARIVAGSRTRYLDNLYRDYALCVELDGLQAHPDEHRWQDLRRMNSITAEGITVLRYSWTDINKHPCSSAAQVAAVLRSRGWKGAFRRCAPGCAAGSP